MASHAREPSDGSASRREVVTRLVEALASRVSPYSGPQMVSYSMRILGSMMRPSSRPDMQAVGHAITKDLRTQGGEWRRFQHLHRRLGGFRMFQHKAYVCTIMNMCYGICIAMSVAVCMWLGVCGYRSRVSVSLTHVGDINSETLQLLLALSEARRTPSSELELVEPLSGPLPALPSYADKDSGAGSGSGAGAGAGVGASTTPVQPPPVPPAVRQAHAPYRLAKDLSFELSEALLLRDMVYVFQARVGLVSALLPSSHE